MNFKNYLKAVGINSILVLFICGWFFVVGFLRANPAFIKIFNCHGFRIEKKSINEVSTFLLNAQVLTFEPLIFL